jgi:CBS domain-containing protein
MPNTRAELGLFYRARVRDLMDPRPLTTPRQASVRDVARLMRRRKTESVVVIEANTPSGIITERDMIHKVVAPGRGGSTPVEAIMSGPLVTIYPEAPLYEALGLMMRHRFRQLVVVDREGRLVGLLSMRDLLRLEGYEAQVIQRRLARACSVEELREIQPEIDDFVHKLVAGDVDPRAVVELVTDFTDGVTRKIISLAERDLEADGMLPPARSFAWLSFGSEGRREQVLRGDQDNGLIFADGPPDDGAREFYRRLAVRVNDDLAAFGFPLCQGGVMAREEAFFGSAAEWRERLFQTVRGIADGDTMRRLTIYLDLRPVAGDRALADEARWGLLRELARFAPAVRALAEDGVTKPVPLGFLGRLQYEKDDAGRPGINVKRYGLLPLVAGVKALAVDRQVEGFSTGERIEALHEVGAIDAEERTNLLAALDLFLRLKLQSSLELVAGRSESSVIFPLEWTEWERDNLKRAFRSVEHLAGLLRFTFSI